MKLRPDANISLRVVLLTLAMFVVGVYAAAAPSWNAFWITAGLAAAAIYCASRDL